MAQMQRVGDHKTTVKADQRMISVVYHSTEVVRVERDLIGNVITLRSGGYRTATTKTRINQAANAYGLGFQVFQKAGDWYVKAADGTVCGFSEGMVIR